MAFIEEGQLVWPKNESRKYIRSMRVVNIVGDRATCQVIYVVVGVVYKEYRLEDLIPAGDG